MAWTIWIAIGIILMIIEIVTPGFIFFSIGSGAIITGILSRVFPGMGITGQVVVFAISTIISFFLTKRFAGILLKPNEEVQSNMYALVGKTATVTQTILPGKKGFAKVAAEEWSALSENPAETIEEGSSVRVVRLEGNKLIVKTNKEF